MIDRPSPLPPIPPGNDYPGGKSLVGVPEWITSQLPAHAFYAEPFAGKGGIYRHKPPALRTWLIDRDPRIVEWWSRLSPPGTIATVGDGIRFCELAAEWGPPDLLLYVDPPYLSETRVKKKLYRYELDRADHVRLLSALTACRCAVAISGYPSALYDDTLAGWTRSTRHVITRGATLREEVLWVNRARASTPIAMEYSDLGENFRERERVDRKATRWASRLAAMPARERTAIMRRLIETFHRLR